MKKLTAKILSVVLCLALLLSLPIPSFAQDNFSLDAVIDSDGDVRLSWDYPSYSDYYSVYVSVNGGSFEYYSMTYGNSCWYFGENGELCFYVIAYCDGDEVGRSNTARLLKYGTYTVSCNAWNYDGFTTINWYSYMSDISGYYIYRSKNNSPFTRIADVKRGEGSSYSYDDYVGNAPATYKYAVITYQTINGVDYYNECFDDYDECIVYMPSPDMTTKSKSQIIKWTSVDGAGSYKIIASKMAIGKYSSSTYTVASVGADVTSYTVKNVDNVKNEYYYQIEAYDYSGNLISKTYEESSNQGRYRFNAAKKKKNIKNVPVINTRGKKNKTAWKVTLSANDKKILKNFAKKNFKKGWSDTQKAEYTLNWINKNVKYATGRDYDKIANKSYVSAIFVSKKGQCLQYNGAYAMFLAYLGYDARIIQGWRGSSTKSKFSHYWCEMKVDGSWYLMETGNYGKNGSWSFFCEPYASTHYSNTRYIMNNKKA